MRLRNNLARIPSISRLPGAGGRGGGGGLPPYKPTAALMDGFESVASWSQGSALTASLDPANAVQGVNAIKYSPNNAATTSPFAINKDFASFDMQTLGAYAFCVNLDEDLDWQDVNSVTMNAILNGSGTVYAGASKTVLANVQSGRMWVSGNLSQFNDPAKAAGVGNHRFRISAQFANAVTGDASYDAFYRAIGPEVRPGIVITGDDAKIQQYSILYPLMKARGLLSGLELYPPAGYFRDVLGGTATFSYAEAKAMSDDGVSIQINGTSDDKVINLSPQRTTVAAWIADLNAQRDLIVSLGIPKPISFCYPFGFLRAPGTRVNRTGISLTTGSNVLPMASTTGIVAGMRAILPGVSRSCTVKSIQADTSVTLSENVQITATKAVSFVTTGDPFQGNAPQDAAIAAGYKWGRANNPGNIFVGFGISRRQAMQYPSLTASGLSLSAFKIFVEGLKASKSVGSIYVHDTTEWTDMVACLDYLQTEVVAGLIDPVNTPALEAKYSNAVPPV